VHPATREGAGFRRRDPDVSLIATPTRAPKKAVYDADLDAVQFSDLPGTSISLPHDKDVAPAIDPAQSLIARCPRAVPPASA